MRESEGKEGKAEEETGWKEGGNREVCVCKDVYVCVAWLLNE